MNKNKCNKLCRIFFALAAFLILSSLFFPIWSYYILMPLYPEGLDFHIHANGFSGDINSINTLNHYTGLAPLDPKIFPEFKLIPMVLIILSLSAFLVSLTGIKFAAKLWFILYAILGIIGLADFYIQLYKYGHNVDPRAPLAVEPQTLVMIGIKRISTITIYAYPNIGAILLLLAAILTFIGIASPRIPFLKSLFLLPLLLTSCSPKPQPIKLGKDSCEYCKMIISDPKFSAEIVLKTGKVYKFDDIGCMVNFFWEKDIKEEEIYMLLVADYKTGNLIDAKKAFYILNDNLRSPMAYNIAAFEKADDASDFYRKNGGRIMNWAEVNEYIRKK